MYISHSYSTAKGGREGGREGWREEKVGRGGGGDKLLWPTYQNAIVPDIIVHK